MINLENYISDVESPSIQYKLIFVSCNPAEAMFEKAQSY